MAAAYDYRSGLSKGAAGAASGALIGSVVPGLGTGIGALIGGGAGLLSGFGGSNTTSQVPLETPEQASARRHLLDFATGGRLPSGFLPGEAVPGLGYGDYNPTGLEMQGQSTLQQILNGGIPDQFRMGDAALKDYLATNPLDVSAQFDPFKAQTQRQIAESNRALTRGAGFAGNLYSTDTIRRLGDIQARGNETLTSQLANLTNESLNRRLQAIPLAYQSGEAQQAAGLQQVGAAEQYGALTRQLNDASIKARDAELLRRRQEAQLPLQALQSVAGTGANFGIPSVTTSPYQDLLSMVGQIGGKYVGNELAFNQYKRLFPGSTPSPVSGQSGASGNLSLFAPS